MAHSVYQKARCRVFLTRIDDIEGDDYRAHQAVAALCEKQRVLFQRKGHNIVILSEKPQRGSEDVSDLLDNLRVGGKFLFRLRINPTITINVGGKNKRIGLPAVRIDAWLNAQFTKNGFSAEYITRSEGVRRSIKGAQTISLLSVLVSGVLTVQEPVSLRSAICNGIGHGKGFGFGLLNVFDVL